MEWVRWLLELVKGAVKGILGIDERERLKASLKDTRQEFEAERQAHAQTKQDLREARQRIAELDRQANPEFLPFRGAMVHRLPSGKLDQAIHCPLCFSSTTAIAGSRSIGGRMVSVPGRFECPKIGCGWTSPFSTIDGRGILEAAAREYGIELL